ncbi:MAG: sigma-70 family RNA polymerase sigma factor [Tannerella sp.]|jgi:RNA polymerase sigma-70 factor (ECF subfamily)|nr:sigma-70 family RNA polymerase sigma factor [Tannerella sp.]
MERLSDNYYVEKVRSGETGCFASLLERYSVQVFSLIVKMVGNREDAEELTQDVFVKAYGSLASFRGESSFSTWIYRIAYNMAVSAVRKKKTVFIPVDEDRMENVPDEPEEAFSETAGPEVRLMNLNRALERLSPEERAMIMLFYKDNKPMEEIAVIAGLTESNVKTKIFRIRKKLWVWIKAMEEQQDEAG